MNTTLTQQYIDKNIPAIVDSKHSKNCLITIRSNYNSRQKSLGHLQKYDEKP